ncbi:MAG: hypothetical protein V3U24_01580 [Candidatus Neomarinimicrobiota bacterium]
MDVKSAVLYSLLFLLVVVLAANFSGVFSAISPSDEGRKDMGELMIDLITIQSLVQAVKIREDPVKKFVQTVDSLNKKWDSKKTRDPFTLRKKAKPVVSAVRRKPPRIRRPSLTVSGIVMDKLKPYAVINGEFYEIGDQFGEYSIESIIDTLIVLTSPRDTFTVKYERYE